MIERPDSANRGEPAGQHGGNATGSGSGTGGGGTPEDYDSDSAGGGGPDLMPSKPGTAPATGGDAPSHGSR